MCTIYRPEETYDKWQQVKSYLKICHYQKSQISTLLLKKSKIVQIEMYNLQTRPVKFKDQKKLKVYSIVKKWTFLEWKQVQCPQISRMFKLLEMSQICLVI